MSNCAGLGDNAPVLIYLLPLALLLLVLSGIVALLAAVITLPALHSTPRHMLFANLLLAEFLDALFTASVVAFDNWSMVQETLHAKQQAVVSPATSNGTLSDLQHEAEAPNSTAWWPGAGACLSAQVLAVTLHAGAVSALACLSLDRYMAVRQPLRYPALCSPGRVGWCLLAAWVFVLTLACAVRIPSPQAQSNGCEMLVLVSHDKLLNVFWLCFMSSVGAAIVFLLYGVWREGAIATKGSGVSRARVTMGLNALHVAVYMLPTPVHNAVRLMLTHEDSGGATADGGGGGSVGGHPQGNSTEQDACLQLSAQRETRTHLLIVTLVHLVQGVTLIASGLRKPEILSLLHRAARVGPYLAK